MVTGGITTRGNELAPLELTYEEIEVAVQEAHAVVVKLLSMPMDTQVLRWV